MGRTASSSASSETTRAPARRGHGSPGALILLGLILLGFAGLVITLQTQTNEAYINGTQHTGNIIQAQWTIWLQIPKLMFGSNVPGPEVSPDDLVGIILGQGIELVYLALIAALQLTMHTSSRLGRLIGTVVLIFLFVIAVFNFYTDLVYGNVSPVAHAAFALFCTLVAGFFPTWGLALIQHGWKRS
jgi:hypothetical protein